MDRSRMNSVLQTLEKVIANRNSRQGLQSEDIQTLRYCTSKLLQYVQTQEKIYKDNLVQHPSNIDNLLITLESADDAMVIQNIVDILQEYVGKTHTSKRASVLVSHGATQILFALMVSEARDSPDELIVNIHSLLGKLGPKDRKFGVKARLGQALPVTLSLIRNHSQNFRILTPSLTVLKLYASNAVNASYLGKNGAISHLFKVLSVCGRKHLSILKMALDTLVSLVKTKSNSARAIGHGGVPTLLAMFSDWHRIDTKNRHIGLRKAILNVLKNITNLKSGRKAFMEAEGIRILYNACQETLQCRELESVIFIASLIMRKCFPRNRLPLSTVRSPFLFPLPQSDFHIPEGASIHIDDPSVAPTPASSNVSTGGEDGKSDDSSIDNDDDLSSDDDVEQNKIESETENEVEGQGELEHERTTEDLLMYETFFPELFEFEVVSDDDEDDLYKRAPLTERLLQRTLNQTTVSDSALYEHTSIPRHQSQPTQSLVDLGQASLPLYGGDLYEDFDQTLKVDETEPSGGSLGNLRRTSSSSEHAMLRGLFHNSNTGENAVAINSRTGSSVFSLDISMPKSTAQVQATKAKTIRARRKGLKSAKGGRRKLKSKALSSMSYDPEFFGNPSATPLGFLDDTGSDDVSTPEEESSSEDTELFRDMASRTSSVGRFNKIPYPEMCGNKFPPYAEKIYERKFGVQRQKIFEDIDRMINPDRLIDRVVYDLDTSVRLAGPAYTSQNSTCNNADEIRVSSQTDNTVDYLRFNSQFECGNLRKAIQVRQYEYDLILNPDVNTNHHHQWFYFEVGNMEPDQKYRFNIVNCEKLNSQFNFGMRPVMFSVKDALQGQPYWIRAGSEICYYRNHFTRSSNTTGGVHGKPYYTTTFTIKFKHGNDVCYLAYHYPYSYSLLQTHLRKLEAGYNSDNIYFRNQNLCQTLAGNNVPVLTLTSYPQSNSQEGIDQFRSRPYIFLSSRVHPGESNSSWVMKGSMQFLLSDSPGAQALRDMYIFKIVPMLNPDGVINGNHRCSLVAEDLNRQWTRPCPKLHPTIYHTKGLLQYLRMINKQPLVYCDYHGHSRRKNVFLYGCSPSMSWMSEDLDNPAMLPDKIEDTGYKTLPRILTSAPAFSLPNCSFEVEKSKETTARVVVWRQIGVVRSYTMESTYCGCDQGPYKGTHINTHQLEEMGRKFCEALLRVRSRHTKTQISDPTLENNDLSPEGATAAVQSFDDAEYEENSHGFDMDNGASQAQGFLAQCLEGDPDSSSGSQTDDEEEYDNDDIT